MMQFPSGVVGNIKTLGQCEGMHLSNENNFKIKAFQVGKKGGALDAA